MSRGADRVPLLRRDGDPQPTARKRKKHDFTATGTDAAVRCASCGRPIGFVEGGDMTGLCSVCNTR